MIFASSDDFVGLVEYIRGMQNNRSAKAMQEPTLLDKLKSSTEEGRIKLLEEYAGRNTCMRAALTDSRCITDFVTEFGTKEIRISRPKYYATLKRELEELIPEQSVEVLANIGKYSMKSLLFKIGAYAVAAMPACFVFATYNKNYDFNDYLALLFVIPFFTAAISYCLTEEKIGYAQAKVAELDYYIAAARGKMKGNNRQDVVELTTTVR